MSSTIILIAVAGIAIIVSELLSSYLIRRSLRNELKALFSIRESSQLSYAGQPALGFKREGKDPVITQSDEPITEEQFRKLLIYEGIISPLVNPPTMVFSSEEFTPINVTGKTISEMIIEERR